MKRILSVVLAAEYVDRTPRRLQQWTEACCFY